MMTLIVLLLYTVFFLGLFGLLAFCDWVLSRREVTS